MIPCPRCGTANAPSAAACGACGAPLAAPAARPAAFKQTMLGMAPNLAPPAAPPPAGPAPQPAAAPTGAAGPPTGMVPLGKQTILGVAPVMSPFAQPGLVPGAVPQPPPSLNHPAAPGQPPPPTALSPGAAAPRHAGGFNQTMLGVPPPNFNAPPAFTPTAPAAAVGPAPGGPSAGFRGTMVQGSPVALPSDPQVPPAGNAGSVAQTLASNGIQEALPPQAGSQPGPPPQAADFGQKRTMMGVAVPGIAPIQPGVPKQTVSSAPPPPMAAPEPPPRPLPERRQQRPRKIHRGAYWLIGAAAALVLGAGALAFFWESPRPLVARLVLDAEGAEKIELECSNCPDGTTLHTDAASAVFKAGKAQLSLRGPLRVGDNHLSVSLERPGIGRDERVDLSVPVQYRVRGDLSGLEEQPPKLRVTIEAAAGAAVVVDGHAITLDPSGKAVHDLPLGSEIEGPSDSVTTLEKRVPYTVTPRDGPPENGEVTLKLGVAPLRIDAPGKRIVVDTEHFMLSGKTAKDGTVSVEGKPITVDVAGRFAQLMNVSAVGETTITVRAALKGHAPRFARVEVKRVESLDDEAAAFSQSAVASYEELADPDARKGTPVALEGRIVESRSENQVTFALLDVAAGCTRAPCLARLVHGREVQLKSGEQITAYGIVTRAVEGPRTGDRIPEVATSFLRQTKSPRR